MAENTDILSSVSDLTRRYKEVLSTRGVTGLLDELQEIAEEWTSTKLSVAVTGRSGSGKSTFINTLFALTSANAAQTDIVECTKELKFYSSPINSNVVLYDLPGVGTSNFPKRSYVKEVNLDTYDFFIIISNDRFTENDTWLAKEIRAREKRFYFVRSHIAQDIENDLESNPDSHDPSQVLRRIRKDCTTKLGPEYKTEIFLIDSFEPEKFDFVKLMTTFVQESSGMKAQILATSLAPITQEILDFKAKFLRARSFAIIVNHMMEVEKRVDLDRFTRKILEEEMAVYVKAFGIEEQMLKHDRDLFRLSELDSEITAVELEELNARLLESAESYTLACNIEMSNILKDLQQKLPVEIVGRGMIIFSLLTGIQNRLHEFATKLFKRIPMEFAKRCCKTDSVSVVSTSQAASTLGQQK